MKTCFGIGMAVLAASGPLYTEPHSFGADAADVIEATQGVVVSVSPHASEAGLEILKRGGNAVDAAVATAFTLAVTWPEAGNIAGGGYMVVYPTGNRGEPVAIDFRETAPATADRDMFVLPTDRTAHRRVGVPGTVRGLALAHQRFGSLPWKELLERAIWLAREGFRLDKATANSLNGVLQTSRGEQHAEMRRIYGKPGGKPWQPGDALTQNDLANTLERIADRGPEGFYTGAIADLLIAEMKRGGGLISMADLASYKAKILPPVHGTYHGYDIYAAPPSSSGGICLVEMLNILENFDLPRETRNTPRTLHLIIEAMRRAYCDRARYLADPAFVSIPEHLTSKAYARKLAENIDTERATPSETLAQDVPIAVEAEHTTHFSVVDSSRMAVSLTYTLENSFGSRIVVNGAGFLLNDEMNDFNWLPGRTDQSGRIGTAPNLVAPKKRMLSSQSPNGCEEANTIELPDTAKNGTKVTRKTYPNGNGVEVVLFVIEGGGHTWPGREPRLTYLGKATKNISANDLMWEFFKKHPMP